MASLEDFGGNGGTNASGPDSFTEAGMVMRTLLSQKRAQLMANQGDSVESTVTENER